MKLNIQSRSGRSLDQVEVTKDTTIAQLKNKFHNKFPKWYPDRQRFTISGTNPPVAIQDEKKIGDYADLKEGATLLFKDLGPQISWTTVFLVEYGGPLFLYPLFYFFPQIFYGVSFDQRPLSLVQNLALYCWTLHYAKRELETLFVHRFSHATMPIMNIIRNSMYYWGCTAMVAYFVNHPLYTSPPIERVYFGLGLFLVSELGNLISHLMLRNLRPAGTTARAIPKGFLFNFVSCPNYFCELTAWIGFTIMTQTLTAGIFTFLGFQQMWQWAIGKHRRYLKEFDGKEGRPLYPRGRKPMIPFLM
eukprot:TRINITY_DN2226_c0_g1_i1.p1 TRINITY_DN2226_c0_g1~~TRINITY_DN2226_c0_g1_i1.p1  ORF type:complete len:304 (-),score=74.23 TRINITY_DN2226_c0_g1_i1:78-989(-)